MSSGPLHVRRRGVGIMGVVFRLSVCVLVQLSFCRCFVVSGEGSEGVDTLPVSGVMVNGEESVKEVTPTVIVGDFSIKPVNKSESRNATVLGGLQGFNTSGQGLNHHGQWGKNGTENETCQETQDQAEKIEQILWDIFVEEDDDTSNDDSQDEQIDSKSEETGLLRDDTEESPDSESTFEEILSDTIDAHNDEEDSHKITKRSAEDDMDVARTGYGHRSHGKRPHSSRYPSKSNKKYRPAQKKGHRVTSRRHTRPRTKTKSKKSPNVNKYNEYMDVVLKRMNSMIKTKHMDPLMVNLFSGGNQPKPGKQTVKKPEKPKKKKNGYTGHKKRKGAKNRARMEEVDEEDEEDEDPEGRSVSSESESGTVELDGVRGVGGVFIRRVGVVEEESDEEEEDDSDGGRSFREIRALIVNGSMKRSSGSNATDEVKPLPSPAPATPQLNSTKSEEEETRAFGNSPAPSTSSEETSRKKQKNKPKPEKKTPTKPKKKEGTKKSKATRGVLKGLSSLKRYGDVDVVRQSDNVRIVRGRFSLGPVTLEIVPRGSGGKKVVAKEEEVDGEDEERGSGGKKRKVGKGTHREDDKKQTPKVTAIARELKGIIEIRIKKHSPTTIKRLRVFPPSSVKIKSADKKPNSKGTSVPRYNRVTPVATHRLRQIASAVVRQADVKRKSSGLEVGKKRS